MNTKLKTEVDNVTYDGVSNADVAAALNLVNVDVVGVLTRKAALKWCTANQLLSVFEDNVDHVDVGIRNIVRAILRVLDMEPMTMCRSHSLSNRSLRQSRYG
jgi:hypothetical protein